MLRVRNTRFQTTNFVFVGIKGQSLYLLLNILNNNTETYTDIQFNKYTFLIRSFYRDLGSKDYLSVQKHTISSILDNSGGANIRITTILADNQARVERPRSNISNSIIRREPYKNTTRLGRLLIRRFFKDEVV